MMYTYQHNKAPAGYKWKKVENNKKKMVHAIERIDNFQDLGPPLLRWRASLEGPSHGEMFADFIMNAEKRQSWDPQIDVVSNLYPINDLDTAILQWDLANTVIA